MERPRHSHILSEGDTEQRSSVLSFGSGIKVDGNAGVKLGYEATPAKDITMEQTLIGKFEAEDFADTPYNVLKGAYGDKDQIELVSELYATELTDLVDIGKVDSLNLVEGDDKLNMTQKKVYTRN